MIELDKAICQLGRPQHTNLILLFLNYVGFIKIKEKEVIK